MGATYRVTRLINVIENAILHCAIDNEFPSCKISAVHWSAGSVIILNSLNDPFTMKWVQLVCNKNLYFLNCLFVHRTNIIHLYNEIDGDYIWWESIMNVIIIIIIILHQIQQNIEGHFNVLPVNLFSDVWNNYSIFPNEQSKY